MVQSASFDLDAAIVEAMSRGDVRIPPYPAVALKVDELIRRGDYGLDEVARLVASDQTLAADALRCANSALYSRGRPVLSLNQAIARIGAKEVARIALASGLGAEARRPGPLAALKRHVWLEALACAALSQELARKRGLDAEEAFVCGLLHDFGKVIAIACIEDVLAKQEQPRPEPLEYWVSAVGRYHVELGLVLAARWRLPEVVSDVISLHHSGDWAGAAEPRLVELAMATDEVVALLGERVWLNPEDLGIVSLLSAEECELVSRVLGELPAFIASFEGAPPGPPAPSVIEEERFDLAGPTPVDFKVNVSVGRLKSGYRAMGIATNNLMITGKQPLSENTLVEIDMESVPPLKCWATAKLTWPEGGGHTVLVQPFALDKAAQAAWKELVKHTTD